MRARVKEKPRVIKVHELLGEAIAELIAAKAQCGVKETYQKYLDSAERLIEEARRI